MSGRARRQSPTGSLHGESEPCPTWWTYTWAWPPSTISPACSLETQLHKLCPRASPVKGRQRQWGDLTYVCIVKRALQSSSVTHPSPHEVAILCLCGENTLRSTRLAKYDYAMLCYAKSLQSWPSLCDPIDGSPPGSPVPGILQARTLEWVAISFSSAWKWKVKVKSLCCVRLLAIPWTVAYQAPPSIGFSRQEYWSGVPLSTIQYF